MQWDRAYHHHSLFEPELRRARLGLAHGRSRSKACLGHGRNRGHTKAGVRKARLLRASRSNGGRRLDCHQGRYRVVGPARSPPQSLCTDG
eukprot:scaffold706_cov418-Prasinococcus_capsulatus_cf.AAC.66